VVVDDDPNIGTIVRRSIAKWLPTWEIALVGSGQAALQLLAAHPAALVITDYQLPDLDGRALAAAIRADAPTTRIILISGLATILDVNAARSAGVDHVLPKPFMLRELEAVVRRLLA
jgi:DNA-binding response OmpR family regulator